MRSLTEAGITRREFLQTTAAAASTLLLAACGSTDVPRPVPAPERKEQTLEGAIYADGKAGWLVRNNELHRIPDLDDYRRVTKAERYGRFVQSGSVPSLVKHPEVPQSIYTFDPLSGLAKENYGEVNFFFFGLFDEENSVIANVQDVEGTFTSLRGNDGLGKAGFDFKRSIFYPFGARGLRTYNLKDTAKDPRILIPDVRAAFAEVRRLNPLLQFNLFGDSIGGLYAYEAAMAFPDSVNNVFTYDSPLLGLVDAKEEDIKAFRVAAFARLAGTAEQATPYLLAIGKDEAYKQGVRHSIKEFTSNGRGFLTFASTADTIVTVNSAYIPEATHVVNGKQIELIRNLRPTGTELWNRVGDHGAIVVDSQARHITVDQVGPNLAKAA